MKTICFYFQVHQPFRLRRYIFFEIGNDSYYYDDFKNKSLLKRIAQKCYLPTNQLLLDLIAKHGKKFNVTFSISGTALEQFERYAPEVLDSFKKLADTGCVEFLAETYSHSLVALKSKAEFQEQVALHVKKIQTLFGQTPKVFRNTELIYSDTIGEYAFDMGFRTTITEGAKHVLGWKSPNYVYYSAVNPKMKLLLKNFKLSDDIAFRFGNQSWPEWPLTAEKYIQWLKATPKEEKLFNLFMDYETFGEHQPAESGIWDFMKWFPETVFARTDFQFVTASGAVEKNPPVAALSVPYPISWADEERDVSAWLGNEMQNEAFSKLYDLKPKVDLCQDPAIKRDWLYLQTSDHFYYMSTKFLNDGDVHRYFSPFDSPYDAFVNYMNVLGDFANRVEKACENIIPPEDLAKQIAAYEEKLKWLKAQAPAPITKNNGSENPAAELEAAKPTKQAKKADPKAKATKPDSSKATKEKVSKPDKSKVKSEA